MAPSSTVSPRPLALDPAAGASAAAKPAPATTAPSWAPATASLTHLPPELVAQVFGHLHLPEPKLRTLGDVGALRLALPGSGAMSFFGQPAVRERIAGALGRAFVRGHLPVHPATGAMLQRYLAPSKSLDLSDVVNFYRHGPFWAAHGLTGLDDLPDKPLLAQFFLGGNAAMQLRLGLLLGRYAQVEHLDLSKNGLATLPQVTASLGQLRSLHLDLNLLDTLPDFLANFAYLHTLSATSNAFAAFPSAALRIPQLRHLNLYNADIRQVPSLLGAATKLATLNLGETDIRSLPADLGELVHLRELDLSTTYLTELPKSVGNLVNLESLSLRETYVTALPQSISKLVNLTHLDIADTAITPLPEFLGSLAKLARLSLGEEQVAALPAHVRAAMGEENEEVVGAALALLKLHLRPKA